MLIPEDLVWMVVLGFIIAFILAFGIGANDVANSFGTSVGSKALTLKQACILATVCELCGAVLLGAKVSTTIRKGIVSVDHFKSVENGTKLLMAGQLSSLGGSCIWLLVATFFRLPVSGTHSIVGATMGFSIVSFGVKAIEWTALAKIVGSWFLSPVLSGAASVAVFYLIRKVVLQKAEPLEPTLRLLPAFYGSVIVVNLFSIFYDGPKALYFDRIPLYGTFVISCGCGILTCFVVKFIWVPVLRRRIITGRTYEFPKIIKWCNCLHFKKDNSYQKDKLESEDTQDHKDGKSITSNDSDYHRHQHHTPQKLTAVAEESNMESHTEMDTNKNTIGNNVIPSENKVNNCGNNQNGDRYRRLTNIVDGRQLGNNKFMSRRVFEVKPSDVNDSVRPSSPISCIIIGYADDDDVNDNDHHPFSQSSDPPNPKPINATGVASLMDEKSSASTPEKLDPIGEEAELMSQIHDPPVVSRSFSILQITTAILGSFAHGGNDVSNAIGPLIGLWIVGTTQMVDSQESTPIWILVFGGAGIAVGLWVWGRRVIQTVGNDLTVISTSSGVCIEIGAAFTVLVASKLGLPISTTHCKVGSVVCVGRVRSKDNVNWRIFRNILIAWLVTLPAAGAVSAVIMLIVTKFI